MRDAGTCWAQRVAPRGDVIAGYFGAVGSTGAKLENEEEPLYAPSPQTAGPELVVNHDVEDDDDPFAQDTDEATGKAVYAATKTVMGRNSADACFVVDNVPRAFPWLYIVAWTGSKRHNAMSLFWPSVRIDIEGENLSPIYNLTMTRRASIWRIFNPAEHLEPKAGEPKIFSIKIVAEK